MGRTKQLLPYKGSTLLQTCIHHCRASMLDQIIVVLGHEADKIRPRIEHPGLQIIVNSMYENGQASSIKKGLSLVSESCQGAMFLLADQPLVTDGLINSLIAQWKQNRSSIVVPYYQNQRGNPVIFPKTLFGRLNQLDGDTGGRELLETYKHQIRKVPIDDPAILLDIDRPEDYDRLINNSGF